VKVVIPGEGPVGRVGLDRHAEQFGAIEILFHDLVERNDGSEPPADMDALLVLVGLLTLAPVGERPLEGFAAGGCAQEDHRIEETLEGGATRSIGEDGKAEPGGVPTQFGLAFFNQTDVNLERGHGRGLFSILTRQA
jgi:hypothetical protein